MSDKQFWSLIDKYEVNGKVIEWEALTNLVCKYDNYDYNLSISDLELIYKSAIPNEVKELAKELC